MAEGYNTTITVKKFFACYSKPIGCALCVLPYKRKGLKNKGQDLKKNWIWIVTAIAFTFLVGAFLGPKAGSYTGVACIFGVWNIWKTHKVESEKKQTDKVRSKISLLLPLNTPLKRTAGLVLFIGLTLSVAGVIQFASDRTYFFIEDWLYAIYSTGSYNARKYWLCRWGAYLTIFGLLFSYLYDQTIKKIVDWIKD